MVEITLTRILLAVILVSLVVAVFGGTYVEMNKYYDVEVDQDFYKTYTRLESATNVSYEIAGEIEKKELGEPSNFVIAASTGISVLKVVYISLIKIPKEVISAIFFDLPVGIHPAFRIATISALMILIVLLIVAAFIRWKL